MVYCIILLAHTATKGTLFATNLLIIPFIGQATMNAKTRRTAGIILLTIPSIEFGGYFLVQVLSGQTPELVLTEFQQAMFRAGHAHAGVLIILSLVALLLADYGQVSERVGQVVRVGFPSAAVLMSGGFFAAAMGAGRTTPNAWIGLLYVGAVVLAVSLIVLGVALLRAPVEAAFEN